MDREKRFYILDRIHECFSWFCLMGFGSLIFLISMQDKMSILARFIWLAIATCLLFGCDTFFWNGFAKEYVIYRYLEYGESFNDNARPLRSIRYRYDDYLSENSQEQRFSISFMGYLFYLALTAIAGLTANIIATWIARIVTGIAISIAISLAMARIVLRFRRRHDGVIDFRI